MAELWDFRGAVGYVRVPGAPSDAKWGWRIEQLQPAGSLEQWRAVDEGSAASLDACVTAGEAALTAWRGRIAAVRAEILARPDLTRFFDVRQVVYTFEDL